jgi:hypothetical protein
MADVWCAFEESWYPDTVFQPYEGGPRLVHVGALPAHTNDGLALRSRGGPSTAGAMADETYGHGPMAEPAPPPEP